MAGESPGRSEQRKSSGATAEAEAGRDPRLAVFGTRPGGAEAGADGRDGADGADGADSPEGAGGKDGGDGAEVPATGGAAAKAVPSQGGAAPEDTAAEDEAPGDEAADGETPDGEAADGDADEAASPKAGTESDGAGTGTAGNARETAEQGDERLREAVAAWVATSDGERPAEDTAQDTAGDTAPEGKAGAPAGPAADTVEEDAAGRADLVTAAFGGLRAARAESSDRGGPSGAGASAEGGGDRGTMVFGRPLPDDEEREATGPSGPSTGETADDAGTVDAEERPDPDGTTEDRDGSEPLAKAKAKAKAAATPAAPEGGDEEAPAGSAQDGKPSEDADKARPGESGTAASLGTESPGTESPKKPESAGSAPSTEKTETAEKTESSEGTPDHGSADAGGGAAGAATGGGGSGGKPVDQPTAVFRVRKPGEPDGSGPAGGTAEPGADGPGDGDTEPTAGDGDRKGTAGAVAKPVADKAVGGRPESGKSGDGKSGDDKSGSAKPEAATPETAKSEPGKPESGKPDDGKPEPGKPEPAKSGAAEPAVGRTSTFVPLQSADSAPRTPAPSKTPSSGPSWAARPDAAPADSASGSGASGARAEAGAGAGAAATAAPEAAPAGESEVERTKQQPLPPLDLLAKLTNTPPPPETPLRTLVRRVKIWTPLVLLLLIVFAIAQSIRPLPEPELRLTAASEYAFKGQKPSLPWPDEGQAYVEIDGLGSLGSSGEEKPVPIASVAKVMTAYVFLREHPVKKGDEGVKMKVDAQAVEDYETGKADSESVVRLTEGQTLSEYEALEALMLPSANNVARLMARWYEKENGEDFVAAMNDAAKDLGMKNTTFTDPSGLEKTTVSTAKDLVKLGKAAMAIPVFKEISAKPFYIDSNDDKQLNYNRLIPYTGIGIKTGTSTAAGGNLLFAAEQEIAGTKQLIVGAALGQYKVPAIDSVTEVSKQLIESAQAVLTDAKVVEKGQVVGHVDDGLGGTVPVVATEDVTAVGWPGLTVELALSDGGKTVPHEAEAGTEVGLLTVGSGPGQVKVPVALGKAKEEPGFGSKLTRIL
ncbi:D-alanyl-D-alanine carboxypeptidase [Streptomyces sp. MNU89]|uniref:D-alanyl-D-alanine carboxypeptidase n=1 Tax=Streptomyces sp. MNU89 TaxID=2560025 RepID=UPI001E2F9821|nr:D-alanyl-D-alanine carboxypeptidase [Streptomyces sp. MNU89]MCC9740941.1 D-alanyl-D-alanine carboxypeptidase [Streptomyces sp. MNU89]